ncbi:MAG: hypothetical protein LC659_11480, partial [Myxococcales bacterium]|nr:hypothetical protein [Myxococcales bacterium]
MAERASQKARAAKRAVKKTAKPRKAKLKPPTQEAAMQAAFDLSRQLSLEVREEELIGTFAATLGALLPERYLCLRVVEPRSLALSSMISDGPLAAGVLAMQAAPLAVKRSALRRTRLSDAVTQSQRIRIVDG